MASIKKRKVDGGEVVTQADCADDPIVIVYDIETVHTYKCMGFCFKPQNWVPMMQSARIIQFHARELNTDNSITINCGKGFDFFRDFKCSDGRQFGIKCEHDLICKDSEFENIKEAWDQKLKEWFEEVSERAKCSNKCVVLAAHNGEVFDHLLLARDVPEFQNYGDNMKFLDTIPVLDDSTGEQPPQFMLSKLKIVSGYPTAQSHRADEDVNLLIHILKCKTKNFQVYVENECRNWNIPDFLQFILPRARTWDEMQASIRNIDRFNPTPKTFQTRFEEISKPVLSAVATPQKM